ncbi:hypothetical protein C8R45DRAFT_933943 [Mycena sanguinolenta]|nr:hypothetical protein C8R45DRAFT_933943 [Mycena sanguinolenta]
MSSVPIILAPWMRQGFASGELFISVLHKLQAWAEPVDCLVSFSSEMRVEGKLTQGKSPRDMSRFSAFHFCGYFSFLGTPRKRENERLTRRPTGAPALRIFIAHARPPHCRRSRPHDPYVTWHQHRPRDARTPDYAFGILIRRFGQKLSKFLGPKKLKVAVPRFLHSQKAWERKKGSDKNRRFRDFWDQSSKGIIRGPAMPSHSETPQPKLAGLIDNENNIDPARTIPCSRRARCLKANTTILLAVSLPDTRCAVLNGARRDAPRDDAAWSCGAASGGLVWSCVVEGYEGRRTEERESVEVGGWLRHQVRSADRIRVVSPRLLPPTPHRCVSVPSDADTIRPSHLTLLPPTLRQPMRCDGGGGTQHPFPSLSVSASRCVRLGYDDSGMTSQLHIPPASVVASSILRVLLAEEEEQNILELGMNMEVLSPSGAPPLQTSHAVEAGIE